MYHTTSPAMIDSSQILCIQKIMERDLRTTKSTVRRKGASSEFCDCQNASAQFDLHSLTTTITATSSSKNTSAASNLTATPNKSTCDTCDKLRQNVSATNRCRQFNLFSIISQSK
jgi:Tfp pilus assembly protein PilE